MRELQRNNVVTEQKVWRQAFDLCETTWQFRGCLNGTSEADFTSNTCSIDL